MVLEGGGGKSDRPGDRGAREGPAGRRRLVTLIRFAVRTGRFVSGSTGARVVAGRRPGGVLVGASDLELRKADAIRRWAAEAGIPLFFPLTSDELAGATGRSGCRLVYVYDPDLARSIGNELGGDERIW